MGKPPLWKDNGLSSRGRRWSVAALVLVVTAYLVWIWSLPSDTFWAGDMGVKLIQMESLIRSGFTRLSLDYPGQAIDPEGTYFPIARLFAERVNGSWFAVFPPLFPALSAPFYLLLGYRGLYVLPLVSSVVILCSSLVLARRAGIGQHAIYLPVVLGLGSPLFLYSVVFWGHSLGACLCLAGFMLALGPPVRLLRGFSRVAAGAALGLAAAVRPECYWFAAGCVAACLCERGGKPWRGAVQVLFGVVAVSSVSWIFNSVAFGHPLGLHYLLNVRESFGQAPLLSDRAAQAGQNAVRMLLNPSTEEAVNLWILIPLGLFVLACWCRLKWLINAAAVLAMAPIVVLMADPHLKEGLFAVSPICAFWLAGWPFHQKGRGAGFRFRAAVVVSVFIVGVIATSPTAGGWQFGPRLLLPACPLLLLLSVQGLIALQRRFAQKLIFVVFVGCMCVGVVTALHAMHAANRHKTDWRLLRQAFGKIESHVIVTDRPYLPQSLASLYYEKTFFLLPTDDATDLLSRLAQAGVSRFLFVSNAEHVRFTPGRAKGFRALQELPRRTFRQKTTFREYVFRR